jgi:hypothetical protein
MRALAGFATDAGTMPVSKKSMEIGQRPFQDAGDRGSGATLAIFHPLFILRIKYNIIYYTRTGARLRRFLATGARSPRVLEWPLSNLHLYLFGFGCVFDSSFGCVFDSSFPYQGYMNDMPQQQQSAESDKPTCPLCHLPCDSQDGYSSCCGGLILRRPAKERGDILTAAEDPTEKESGRSSSYIGVCKITRRNGAVRWRASLSCLGKVFHIGDYETEIVAGRVYDNARFYASALLKEEKEPLLNFPNTYADAFASMRPPIWIATKRVLRKVEAAKPSLFEA